MAVFFVILFDICTGNDFDVLTVRKKFVKITLLLYKWLFIWIGMPVHMMWNGRISHSHSIKRETYQSTKYRFSSTDRHRQSAQIERASISSVCTCFALECHNHNNKDDQQCCTWAVDAGKWFIHTTGILCIKMLLCFASLYSDLFHSMHSYVLFLNTAVHSVDSTPPVIDNWNNWADKIASPTPLYAMQMPHSDLWVWVRGQRTAERDRSLTLPWLVR